MTTSDIWDCDGTVTHDAWDTLREAPRALAASGATVVALVGTTEAPAAVKRSQGHDQRFALALPANLSAIPSEQGTLFLHARADVAPGAPSSHEIIEIACP